MNGSAAYGSAVRRGIEPGGKVLGAPVHVSSVEVGGVVACHPRPPSPCRVLPPQRDVLPGVVVVAGRYRSGKSFLMNQMTQARTMEGEGFGVGHTVESYTKGIWMLPRAIPGRSASGEPVDVIVMDSEGLGATEQVCGMTAT